MNDNNMVYSKNSSGIYVPSNNTPGTKAFKVTQEDFDSYLGSLRNTLDGLDVTQIDFSKLSRYDVDNLQKLLVPKMTKYIPHVPTVKQTAFLLLNCREAFYGGAAGGGKSDALLMGGLQYVDVKGYAGIIFRQSFADLTKPGALIDRSREWLSSWDDVKWNDKDKKWEFLHRYGPHTEVWSILQFGYLENAKDKYNYQGGEYQFIGFDELVHIDKKSYTYMFSRLRRLKGFNVPLRIRGASNPPDDDQGIWVKERFIDEGLKKGRVFIPAGMRDNPHLDVESYEDSLKELDPITRARLRDGDWQIIRKGNMFKREWFQEVDVLPAFRRRMRFWDMAATDPEVAAKKNKSHDPDFTVGFLISEAQGIFYIEDILRIRKRPSDTEKHQKYCALTDGYQVTIREEQEPGSSGLTAIDQKARTIFLGYNYAGVRSTGNKVTRAAGASAAAERGQIKIYRGCRNKEAFFLELESFPGGLHDDMVDGLSGGYTELGLLPGGGNIESIDNPDGSRWTGESLLDFDDGETAAGYFGRI